MLNARPFSGEIYLHWCPASEKGYVGQTTQGCVKRWKLHLRCALSPHTPAYAGLFAKALRKYGPNGFEHQVLAIANSQAELDGLERLWIWALRTKVPNGYNLTSGGDNGTAGHVVTPEVRARLSAKAKEQWKSPAYQEKHHAGMIAAHRTGTASSVEAKEKRAAGLRAKFCGKKQSLETIAKRIAKTTGLKRSTEFREQCAARMTGRKLSSETRQRMSEAHCRRQESLNE